MPRRLDIGLLGSFLLKSDGDELRLSSKNARLLLAYLASTQKVSHDRKQLARLFWPDASDKAARDSLRQTLSLLRKRLGREPTRMEATRNSIRFQLVEGDSLDTQELRASVKPGGDRKVDDAARAIACYEEAAALIRGEFLSGEEFDSQPALGEWAGHQRATYLRESLSLLGILTERYLETNRWEGAHKVILQQLDLEPLHESAHRQLMRWYVSTGQRADALSHYEAFHTKILDELGAQPSQATKALNRQILNETLPTTDQTEPKASKAAVPPRDTTETSDPDAEIDSTEAPAPDAEIDSDEAPALIVTREASDTTSEAYPSEAEPSEAEHPEAEPSEAEPSEATTPNAEDGSAGSSTEDGGTAAEASDDTSSALDTAQATSTTVGDEPNAANEETAPTSAHAEESTAQEKATDTPTNQEPPCCLPARDGQGTEFFGRQKEIEELLSWFAQGETLVTLHAMGGMGKTRLAVELGYTLHAQKQHRDGVFFVPLAGVMTVERMFSAIAERLNFPFSEGNTLQHQLEKYLEDKEQCVILDNMEQLLQVEGIDALGSLLRCAPKLQWLVTSRQRLCLRQERVYSLGTLGAKEETKEAAVALFMDRATRSNSRWNEAPDAEKHVHTICALVDYVPLAIELAASLVHPFSLDEVEGLLRKDFEALATSWQEVPARHHSFEVVFQSSWQTLSPKEQEVLSKSTVFQGGFTLQAALEILETTPQQLVSLRDKSLLHKRGERYQMHELLRQFAQQEHDDTLHAHHARYFRTWLQEQCLALFGPIDVFDFELPLTIAPGVEDTIATELENIHAAWRWHLEHAPIDEVASFLESIWLWLHHQQRWSECCSWLEDAMKRVSATDETPLPGALWLYQHALATWNMGHFLPAKEQLLQVMALLGHPYPTSSGSQWMRSLSQVWQLLRPPKQHTPHAETAALAPYKTHTDPLLSLKLKTVQWLLHMTSIVDLSLFEFLYSVMIGITTNRTERAAPNSRMLFASQMHVVDHLLGRHNKSEATRQHLLSQNNASLHPTMRAYMGFYLSFTQTCTVPWSQTIAILESGREGFARLPGQWYIQLVTIYYLRLFQGDLAGAQKVAAEVAQLAQQTASELMQHAALGMRGTLGALRGQRDVVQQIREQIRDFSGLPYRSQILQGVEHAMVGWFDHLLDNTEAALASSMQACEIAQKARSLAPHHLTFLTFPLEVLSSALDTPHLQSAYTQQLKLLQKFARKFTVGASGHQIYRGHLLWHLKQPQKAIAAWEEAQHLARKMKMPFEEGQAYAALGAAWTAKEDSGRRALREAEALFARIGAEHARAQVHTLLSI